MRDQTRLKLFVLTACMTTTILFQNCAGGFNASSLLGEGTGGASLSSRNHSANDVQVSDAAPAGAPKCDGQSDDTAAIQGMVDAGVNKQVIVGGNAPCMIRGLRLPSNTHLTVNGTLKLIPGSSTSLILSLNQSNITVDGSGTLDGSWDMQQSACAEQYGCGGVNTYGGSNIHVGSPNSTLTIQRMRHWPVNIVTANGATMENLNAIDSGNSVEFASGTSNCAARNLRISGIHDMGFAFYGAVTNCSLSDSITSNNESDGVTILNDEAQAGICHDILVQNVESFGNIGASAISIANNGNVAGPHYNITVNDLRSHDNGRNDVYMPTGTNVVFNRLVTRGNAVTTGTIVSNSPNPSGTVSTNVIGNLDGVTSDGAGGYLVGGWACTLFDTRSLQVDLYVGGSAGSAGATGVGRFQANKGSEAGVATNCKSSGTAYRFQIPLSAAFVNANGGKQIYVHGLSPWLAFGNNAIAGSGTVRIPASSAQAPATTAPAVTAPVAQNVIGIFGVASDGLISGWACVTGRSDSLAVHFYIRGPAGSGVFAAATTANLSNEQAVNDQCGAKGAFRFQIKMDSAFMNAFRGDKIYIHGISSVGGANNLLSNSGNFTVP